GTANDGEKVTIKFEQQTVTATTKDGRWLVRLKPLKAGGPFTLTVAGENNTLTFTNVLVGEVWLCSGQSNMGFQLSRAANAAEAIAAAGDPQLRLFTVPHSAVDTPATDTAGAWMESTPESAAKFSAVAWFFGRELRKTLRVPVGLINSSVGGTPAEAWTSHSTLEGDPELKRALERYADSVKNYDPVAAAAKHQKALEQYKANVSKAKAAGERLPATPRPPADPSHSTS